MKRAIPALAALALLFACLGRARGDLIVNGGFETGDFTGWTVGNTSPSITFVSNNPNSYFVPQSGNYLAVFGNPLADGLATVSQTVADTPGQQYTLSMYVDSGDTIPNEFQVQWDGSIIYDQKNIPYASWTLLSVPVEGTGSDLLSLNGADDPDFLALDSVSLNPVPEPATLSLLMMALAGTGIIGLRARRATRCERLAAFTTAAAR